MTTTTHKIECDECGGTGADPGGLSAYERTDCVFCGGAGYRESVYDIGDVIEYCDQETGAIVRATVIDYGAPEWLEVAHDGRPEDDAGVHESLVVRVVSWSEYLHGKPAASAAAAVAAKEAA